MSQAERATTLLDDAVRVYASTYLLEETGDADAFAVAWTVVIEATSPTLDAADRYELLRHSPDGQRATHTRGLLHEALSDMDIPGGSDD